MIGLYIRPTKENGLRNMVNHNSSYVIVEKSIKVTGANLKHVSKMVITSPSLA